MPPGGPPPAGPPAGDPAFGGTASVGGTATFGTPPAPAPVADDEEIRAMGLAEQVSLNGSTGLLHTAYAGSSPAQMFRVSFLADWFTTSGFLCNSETDCDGAGTEDDHSHVGAFFALNATPISFLEAYAGIRTYANSNSMGSPVLLQVLGDTTLGVKLFTPFRIGNNLTVGGDFRLLLLNGAGDVGVSGAGTSAEFVALATSDFRKIKGKGAGAPVRLHLNLGYRIDNSGELVADVETLRAQRDPDSAGDLDRIPVSRVERYGLGINRVDFFQLRLGLDVPYRWIQPYIEYDVDIPVNRQGYECHTRTISPGDVCLALADPALSDPNFGGIGYDGVPSRISIGARTNPLWDAFRGLSAHLAFDIGIAGTSTFIEEVAPTAPWTLWFGLAYSFDTKKKEPKVIQPPPVPQPPAPQPPPPQYFVRGQVVEKGTGTPVVNAIITVEGSIDPPVATGADGRFLTHEVQPAPTVNLSITADGYNPGTCTATVNPAGGPPPLVPVPDPTMPPGWPGAPGTPMPGTGPGMPPAQPSGPQYTDVNCELEPLPKDGGIQGAVQGEDGSGIAGANVEVIDATGAAHTAQTAIDGTFSFPALPLGMVKVKADHPDYFLHLQQAEVKAREQTKIAATLIARPKQASVRVVGRQIQMSKPILWTEASSAVIKPESYPLLAELADVLHRNPNITKIEIQGHTDNSGPADVLMKLSQDRADAIRDWLITSGGVDAGRIEAKGYGATRPLAPNVTPANRARNRRIQVFITERT